MLFNEVLGIQNIDREKFKIYTRRAIRAIVMSDDKVLLVKSNLGDYKFPGGGIEITEKPKETLMREVTEETGYRVKEICDQAGRMVERNKDRFDNNGLFEMTSDYYFCQVSEKQGSQKLDDYEKKLDFQPFWIRIDEAIAANEAVLNNPKEKINPWVKRETKVLKTLMELNV